MAVVKASVTSNEEERKVVLEKFNVVAGMILDGAVEGCPMPTILDADGIIRQLPEHWRTPLEKAGPAYGDVHRDDILYVQAVNKWLKDEGFLRDAGSNHSAFRNVLTSKGITALNVAPEFLGGQESLGNRLRRGVAEKSWDVVIATIPSILGVMTR